MAVTIILDPHLKMIMLQASYMALLGQEEADRYCQKSYELLTQLMDEYQVQIDQEIVGTSSYGASNSTSSAATILSIFKTLAATKKTSSLVKAKSELDWYLDKDPLSHDENEYFDVLGWWKVAGTCFPTLRLIARDILAIPITTVASESTFSTSGIGQDDRKIDTFWSCLEDIEEEMKEEPYMSTIDSD
ncbi:zinc finger BED domain-containing protein RICESLEEPER 1-like [Miscanthus floridulus]|uniref:zinc finger BED domain-containing protein RICESLEEPER 1-like n=1 Tax=Miscanthus floridulus TaxID=154761 RepID=UPI003458C166